MRLVDAHCHFDFPCFDGHRDELLQAAAGLGIRALVIPGVRRRNWDRVAALAESRSDLWYCLGIHPWFAHECRADDLDALEQALSRRPKSCIGIGECGLDALRGNVQEQQACFQAQVALSMKFGLPLVIHSVKTHDLVYVALKRVGWSGAALVHGFSGSYQQARKLVDLGCLIGVGGVITHDRAGKTRDALSRLPRESLILETDAPDMAPQGVARGQNSPVHLPAILAALSQLRGERVEALADALLKNVSRLYGVDVDTLAPAAL